MLKNPNSSGSTNKLVWDPLYRYVRELAKHKVIVTQRTQSKDLYDSIVTNEEKLTGGLLSAPRFLEDVFFFFFKVFSRLCSSACS